MTDPEDVVNRAARADALPDGPGAGEDGGASAGSGTTIDYNCHRCGDALTPTTGRSTAGRSERTGICSDCRTDGIGGATFVTIDDPDAIRPATIERLDSRQRGASAQSTEAAAAFIDDRLPAGDYEVRRTAPFELTVRASVDGDALRELAERYARAGPWDVNDIDVDDGRIVLTDRQFGDSDPVIAGP